MGEEARAVTLPEIEQLAIGAWILGTGGGGSPYHGLLNMRTLYREGAAVRLLDPAALADEDDVAVVSFMGAPLVGQERRKGDGPQADATLLKEPAAG